MVHNDIFSSYHSKLAKDNIVMPRRKMKGSTSEAIGALIILGALFGLIKILYAIGGDGVLLILFVAAGIVIARLLWKAKRKSKIRSALLGAGTENPMQLTPGQYENFCAALLENNGWTTKMTKSSGDFGADIIAVKGNKKSVIQCKQWSKSVGVKAVQEAHTAMSYYHANIAIVVTTTGYTYAAKDLAKSTGVRLLKHTDLIDI